MSVRVLVFLTSSTWFSRAQIIHLHLMLMSFYLSNLMFENYSVLSDGLYFAPCMYMYSYVYTFIPHYDVVDRLLMRVCVA